MSFAALTFHTDYFNGEEIQTGTICLLDGMKLALLTSIFVNLKSHMTADDAKFNRQAPPSTVIRKRETYVHVWTLLSSIVICGMNLKNIISQTNSMEARKHHKKRDHRKLFVLFRHAFALII